MCFGEHVEIKVQLKASFMGCYPYTFETRFLAGLELNSMARLACYLSTYPSSLPNAELMHRYATMPDFLYVGSGY